MNTRQTLAGDKDNNGFPEVMEPWWLVPRCVLVASLAAFEDFTLLPDQNT
jgi:hypothetical protein